MAGTGEWGGRRPGAGRKPGSGQPKEKIRRNRLMVSVTDQELAALQRLAAKQGIPPATLVYRIVAGCLQRRT